MKINTLYFMFFLSFISVSVLKGSAPESGKNYLDLLGAVQPVSLSDQIDADSKRQAQLKAAMAAPMSDDNDNNGQAAARSVAVVSAAGAGAGASIILRTKDDVTPAHYAKLAQLSRALGLPAAAVAIRTQDGSMVTQVARAPRNKPKSLADYFLGARLMPVELLNGPMQEYMNTSQRYMPQYAWQLKDVKNDPAITLMGVDASHAQFGDIVTVKIARNSKQCIVLDSNGMFHLIENTAEGPRRIRLLQEENNREDGIKDFHCIGKEKKCFAYVGGDSIIVRDSESFTKMSDHEAGYYDEDAEDPNGYSYSNKDEVISSRPDGKELLIRDKRCWYPGLSICLIDKNEKFDYREECLSGHYLPDNKHAIFFYGYYLCKDIIDCDDNGHSVAELKLPFSHNYKMLIVSPEGAMAALFKTFISRNRFEHDLAYQKPYNACVIDLNSFKIKYMMPTACFLMEFSADEKELATVVDDGDSKEDDTYHRQIIVYALVDATHAIEKAADSKESEEARINEHLLPKELWRATSQEPVKKLLYGPNGLLMAATKSGLSIFRKKFSMDQTLLDTMAKEQHDKDGKNFNLNAIAQSYNLDKKVVQETFNSMSLADQERLENCAGRNIENAQKIAMSCVKRLMNEAGITKQEKATLEEKCILYLKMVKDLCKNNQQVLQAFERRIKAIVLREEKPFSTEMVEESNRRLKRHILGLINQGLGDKGSVIS